MEAAVLRSAISEYAEAYVVPTPNLVVLDRRDWWGERPASGAYKYEKGRFVPPGGEITGSFRTGNPSRRFQSPTVVLYAPEGTNEGTLRHEFAHYLAWLDGEFASTTEAEIEEIERRIGGRIG